MMGLLSGLFRGNLDQAAEDESAVATLTPEHREALDGCYDAPQLLAEVDDDEWMQQLRDLRAAGLVIFDDDGTEATITAAGIEYMDHDDELAEDDEEEPTHEYDVGYTSFLDVFYDAPLPEAEWGKDADLVQQLVANGHLDGPDSNGYVHITDAGVALLDS